MAGCFLKRRSEKNFVRFLSSRSSCWNTLCFRIGRLLFNTKDTKDTKPAVRMRQGFVEIGIEHMHEHEKG